MSDTLALTAILTSALSLVLSILTHVKKSKCCGACECQTRNLVAISAPTTPTAETPLLHNNIQHSNPISIPSQIPVKRVYL